MIVRRLSLPNKSFTFEGNFFAPGLEGPQIGRVRLAPARMSLMYVVGAARISLATTEKGLFVYLDHRLIYGLDYGDQTAQIAQTTFVAQGLQEMVDLGLRA